MVATLNEYSYYSTKIDDLPVELGEAFADSPYSLSLLLLYVHLI